MFWPRGGPPGSGGPKQGLESIYRRNRETRKFFYKTNVVGKVCFSRGGSYFWARNPDLEGLGSHVLLEPWSINFRQILLNKRCCTPSQQSPWSGLDLLDLALTLKQGSGGPKEGLESIPCHFCPHSTLYYFNIMTRARPGSPSYIIYK